MTDTPTRHAVVEADLREQWDALLAWVEQLDDTAFDEPSVLPGWSVGDLVAHLGIAMNGLTVCEPIDGPTDERRLEIGDYIGQYGDSASSTSARTVAESQRIASDRVAGIEAEGTRAFTHLDQLHRGGPDPLVRSRRGPMRLSDVVMTRLIELVVHADDLARSVPVTSPVDPTARTLVAEEFLRLLNSRAGTQVVVGDERTWVRLASGRLAWRERGDALRPGALSDGLPDLSAHLPLL
ncbi:conserved hypothetical protein [Beutenbergia cavernae DSM 12333]|uniref:Mycothiol-dependent maleylpyruvate isomerase metal-binding domain-containing protein n=1 Tax=Beutenbergia cavernae (strain ATCC BAA-8 / DSM 12333 / CCUG 43141 / JCM 11478 / NBRC 16432 / NCIMB 13614 / HKI 0122) TaxID=471853 RepID=C5BYJ3_BEUC1|nr:maleylpyruvate isomerase family mycothiol-dependent enzyme [Beutenbergia cavernae]ACQ78951.1 conserved hypothetical protein [Beutenbergia cavernae DSM 12333]